MTDDKTKTQLPIKGADPISVRRAAELLGFKGEARTAERRLRRFIRRRERVTGETILVRVGTDRKERHLVMLPLLRQHCPELFDTRAEAEELLREQFESIEDKLHRLERQDEALAQELIRQRRNPAQRA